MKLRVGLIGLGPHWETRYRPALRALRDRFDVRAIFDQVAHRARQAAREFDAVVADGLRALVERQDVEAVLLLSRQWMGTLPILFAAEAEKALYCASHLDLDLEEARHLQSVVDKSGIAFMSELTKRHAPATVRLKELIATKLGAPRLLFGHYRQPGGRPQHQRPSLLQRLENEGPLSDLVEQVDWCRYVVGSEPTSVIGLMHLAKSEWSVEEDYQMMSLDFSEAGQPGTGPLAQISCGRYISREWEEAITFRPPAGLQVACENGIAFLDLPTKVIWFDDAGRHQEMLDSERPLGEQLLLRFYRSVMSLLRPGSSLDDITIALELIHQARQAHHDGRRVSFSLPPRMTG